MMKTMKKITIIAAMMLALGISASAHKTCGEDWREKMMCEKIAFLTAELGITPEEAQAFWPVYNEIHKEKDKATHEVFRAYKSLKEGLETGKPEKEIGKLLDNYLEALENQRDVEEKATQTLSKALSVGKLARLYVGEEKFRRQHIRKMKGAQGHKPDQANK